MPRKTYTCRRYWQSVGRFEYTADFSQAASNILVRFETHDENAWQNVPFQVADARHNHRNAERMIAEYFD